MTLLIHPQGPIAELYEPLAEVKIDLANASKTSRQGHRSAANYARNGGAQERWVYPDMQQRAPEDHALETIHTLRVGGSARTDA